MSSLAWIGSSGNATGPTPSTSSSGASSSAVPAAKKSPGRRTMLNNAARSAVIMDMRPAGETLMGEVDSMASFPPRLPRAPIYASLPEGFEAIGCELGVAHRVLDVLVAEVMLQGPRVLLVIGQRVAEGMPQHVRMHRERETPPPRPCASILRKPAGDIGVR